MKKSTVVRCYSALKVNAIAAIFTLVSMYTVQAAEVQASPPEPIEINIVTKNATPQTRSLFAFLKTIPNFENVLTI